MKTRHLLIAVFFLCNLSRLSAQCLVAPSYASLLGTEPLVTAGETLLSSQTKWFHGTSATLNNVSLRGGKLVVSGDLTLDNLVFETGELVILPGAKLVVTNGAGLVLRGNCYIYNWGSFQSLGNIVMDYGITSAAHPNIIINATASAVWKMSNQYFVINNPWSKFVNMGSADFHGIITDPGASTGSVCLGDTSVTTMRVLYNNAKNTYVIPSGIACLSVELYSQFKDTLTTHPNINVCLGASHTSDASCIPWGCKPNAWGAAHVARNCVGCAGYKWLLPTYVLEARVKQNHSSNLLEWRTNPATSLPEQQIERSSDGMNFVPVKGKVTSTNDGFQFSDKAIQAGMNYYRITVRKKRKRRRVGQ